MCDKASSKSARVGVQVAVLLRAGCFLFGHQRLQGRRVNSAIVWCVLPVAALQDELERLKAENTRLFRDNERFVRLVSMHGGPSCLVRTPLHHAGPNLSLPRTCLCNISF